MSEDTVVTLTIALDDPQLEPEEQEEIVQSLVNQLSDLEEIEQVERPENPHPTEGGRPAVEYLIGVLMAKVNWNNLKSVLGFVGDRLGDKQIKIKLKVKDIEIEIEAKSRQELIEAKKLIDEIIQTARG
jgi:hypothetical protein